MKSTKNYKTLVARSSFLTAISKAHNEIAIISFYHLFLTYLHIAVELKRDLAYYINKIIRFVLL